MKKYLAPFFLFLLVSCISKKASDIKIDCHTPGIVSFHSDLLPIFNQSCSLSGCHSGTSPAGGLNLEPTQAYDQLMTPGSGYIDTINPKFSLLYAQMHSLSQPMPPSGRLDSCTIQLVLTWIEQKAKDN